MCPTDSDNNSAKIKELENGEWEIDIRQCHGLDMEGGDFPNPYETPGQIEVTSIGSVRGGVISSGIEEAITHAGGFTTVGSKMAFKVVGAVPDMALNVVISLNEENIYQATISSAVGVGASILVTTAVGSTGVLAPVAPIIGAVIGDLANSTVDMIFDSIDGADVSSDDYQTQANQTLTPQLASNHATINYNQGTGEFNSNLPEDLNQSIVNDLREAGQPVHSIGTATDIVGTEVAFDKLLYPDGSIFVDRDPEGRWEIVRKEDGSGTAYHNDPVTGERVETKFKAGEVLEINGVDSDTAFHVEMNLSGIVRARTANAEEIFGDESAQDKVVEVNTFTPSDPITTVQPAQNPQSFIYTIQPGDTLSEIAEQYNTTVENILESNPDITDRNVIRAGASLNLSIPPTQAEPESTAPDLQGLQEFWDNTTHYYKDNNPNQFTAYPDGRIVEHLSIASSTGGSVQSRIINEDNLPTNREEYLEQLRDEGLSDEEAERIAGTADEEMLAANQSGEGWVNEELLRDAAADFWGDTDMDLLADEPVPQQPKEDINKAALDFMQSQIGLRDAINSGNGLDIAREGTGFVSSLDDLADAGSDGFLDRSQEAVFDGIEHSIGLGQAIDEGDGWEIAGNSIDLLLAMELGLDANQACAYERAF